MSFFERVLLKLDVPPVSWVLRATLGFVLFWFYAAVCKGSCPSWVLYAGFLFVLLALRGGPLIIRKTIRFSKEANEIWRMRRQWALYHDSYQWQKLFWMGLGMMAYILGSTERDLAAVYLATFCMVSGAFGLVIWMMVNPTRPSAASQAGLEKGAQPVVSTKKPA